MAIISSETKVTLPTDFEFVETTDQIDFEIVAKLLNTYGLSEGDAEEQERIFKASQGVEFIYHRGQLIACGRALSDNIAQTAVYNIAVDEKFHHQGLGKLLMQRIIERFAHTNIVLYTHPDTVSWYEEIGFSNLNTGMIIFGKEDIQWFKDVGFVK